MVHKKYTYKDGKRYGPYLYENKRVGDKIVTTYLGTADSKHSSKKINFQFLWIAVGVLVVLLLLFFAFQNSFFNGLTSTGKVSLDIKSNYKSGERLDGKLEFNLRAGELIPENSKIIVSFGGEEKEFSLSELVSDSVVYGNYYASGSSISGEGEGYGIAGEKVSYPEVSFSLEIFVKGTEEGGVGSGEIIGENESILNETIAGNESAIANETAFGNESLINETIVGNESVVEEVIGEANESIEEPKESVKEEKKEQKAEEKEEKEDEMGNSFITGEAIDEKSYFINGKASINKSFSYPIGKNEDVKLVAGSVKANAGTIEDSAVSVKIRDRMAEVSTDYSVVERGFGEGFIGDKEMSLEIDISKLGFVVGSSGELSVKLSYNEEVLVEVKEDILVGESELNVSIVNETLVNKTIANETIANETIVNLTVSNISEDTIQYGAVLGKPVRWKKSLKADAETNFAVEIPSIATNISVVKIVKGEIKEEEQAGNEGVGEEIVNGSDEGEIVNGEEINISIRESTITGEVSAEIEISKEPKFVKFFKRLFRFTGLAVSEEQDTQIVEIGESAKEVEIEYYTDAPYAIEDENEKGKKVQIIGPEEVHYEDVLVFTELNESWNVKDRGKVKIYWEENNTYLPVLNVNDSDGNGIYDYVEWIAPHLSNQTFNIILITKAEHLGSNREFISDIYDFVKELDGNWSETIGEGEYVRVTFEKKLSSGNDITLYPRIVSGEPKIEVYEVDKEEKIAEFNPINSNEYNKVFLTNLAGQQDVFDLRVIEGDVEIEHIIDPPPIVLLTIDRYVRLCGEVNNYTAIFIKNSSGILDICPYTAAGTGYVNITLGTNGNFTIIDGGIVNGSEKGVAGGAGSTQSGQATQGTRGDSITAGAASVNTNGGGGGGGNSTSTSSAGTGGGGGFGGAGGRGGNSSNAAQSRPGLGGLAYGNDSDAKTLFRGSGGGGGCGDAANAGGAGGGGFKVNAGSGYIYINGTINVTGRYGVGVDSTDSGAGGGGSGGHIILIANEINVSLAKIDIAGARGGNTGVNARDCGGGGGGGGRVVFVYQTLTNSTTITNIAGGAAGSGACTYAPLQGSAGSVYWNSTTASWPSIASPNLTFISPTQNSGAIVKSNYIEVNVSAAAYTYSLARIEIRLFNSSGVQIKNTSAISSPLYVNFSGLADGIYYFNASANDSSANVNETETRNITLDTSAPTISLLNPPNNTGVTNSLVWFNALFINNNVSNTTLYIYNSTGQWIGANFTRLGNATITTNISFTLNYTGTFYWNFLAYDSVSNKAFNNTNWSVTYTAPDLEYPVFSNYWDNNGTLNSTGIAFFNATIKNTNGSAFLQINGTNFTAQNWSATEYNISLIMANNTYEYQWISWGNGSSKNINKSVIRYYSVNESPKEMYPVFSSYWDNNGTLNSTGIAFFNATIKNTNGSAFLQINGTNFTAQNWTDTLYNISLVIANDTYAYQWISWSNGSSRNINKSVIRYYSVNETKALVPYTIINYPTNNTNTANSSVILNWSVYDNGNSNEVFVYAGNDTANLQNYLVYHGIGMTNGTYTYNYTAQPIRADASTVLLLHFDNLSSYAENQSLAYDFSGNRNNATIQDGIWNETAKFAGGYEFNGIIGIRNISIANSDSLNLSSFTLAAWIYKRGNGDGAYSGSSGMYVYPVFCKGLAEADGTGVDVNFLFGVNTTTGTLQGDYEDIGGPNHPVTNAVTIINNNQWYHAVYTRNASGSFVFVNGKLEGSRIDTTAPASNLVRLGIGTTYQSSGGNGGADYGGAWNGTIDEVGIWNRSLSKTEIAALYNLSFGMHYWRVNATDGTNMNSSGIYQFNLSQGEPDLEYPSFVNAWDNNGTLNSTGIAFLNVSILKSNGSALLQINGTNFTAQNWSATEYNISLIIANGTYEYQWISWGNGSSKNINKSVIRYYSVNASDTQMYPVFSNYWDNNGTLNSTGIAFFNATIKNTNGSAFLQINGTNFTAQNWTDTLYNISLVIANDTYAYQWISWSNGSSRNINKSVIRYYSVNETLIDKDYPIFSNYGDNNGSLNSTGIAWFNVSIKSTNGTVLLQINGTNFTAQNVSSASEFNVTITMINDTYEYQWISWGNGSSKNINKSVIRYYSVNESPKEMYPVFSSYWDNNGTLNSTGIAFFNATIKNTNGSAFLQINGTNFTAQNWTDTLYNISLVIANDTYAYQWISWSNGSSRNINKSVIRYYSVNETPPDLEYPSFVNAWDNNGTLNSTGIAFLNVSILKSNGSALLQINGTNFTAQNWTDTLYNISLVIANDTYAYQWISWGNGSSKNINKSVIRYYSVNASDTQMYPVFSNYWDNNGTLNSTGIAFFNATIKNTNGSAFLQINGTNFTAQNWTDTLYNISLVIANDTYAYQWISWSNGSSRNINKSVIRYYSVNETLAATDNTAPIVTIKKPGNITYYTPDLPLEFNVTLNENGSCSYSLDSGLVNITMSGNEGKWFGTNLNATNDSIADGGYTVNYYCNDTSGNWNRTASVSFSFADAHRIYYSGAVNSSEYNITGLTDGGLANFGNYSSDQVITFNHSQYGMVLEFVGLFGSSDVNLSSIVINTSGSKVAVNISNASGISLNHTLFMLNSTGTGFYVCPGSSASLDDVSEGCSNIIMFSNDEADTGTWKDGIYGGVRGNFYEASNLTSSGLGGVIPPGINFTAPIFSNWTSTSNTSIEINISINESFLNEVKFNWNGTNYTIYNDSLVLYINFNNVSSLGDNITIATDVSTYKNNGNLTNAGYTPGKYDFGLNITAATGIVNVSYKQLNLVKNITVSGWFLENANGAADMRGAIKYGTSDAAFGILTESTTDKLKCEFTNAAGTNSQVEAATTFSNGVWTFVTCAYNDTNMMIYINGALSNIAAITNTAQVSTNNFYIGNSIAMNRAWIGAIDEVMVFNRTLSASEIQQLYFTNLYKYGPSSWALYLNQSKNSTNGLGVGKYTYFASAKDINGNENRTEIRDVNITSSMDSVYPSFVNAWDNNGTLNDTGIAFFNVSILSSNGSAFLQINGTNFTAQNWSATEYNISLVIANDTYAYQWISWGNGSSRNINKSVIRYYTVNTSAAAADTVYPNITLNAPVNYANSTSINISFNCTSFDDTELKNVTLYFNSTAGGTTASSITGAVDAFNISTANAAPTTNFGRSGTASLINEDTGSCVSGTTTDCFRLGFAESGVVSDYADIVVQFNVTPLGISDYSNIFNLTFTMKYCLDGSTTLSTVDCANSDDFEGTRNSYKIWLYNFSSGERVNFATWENAQNKRNILETQTDNYTNTNFEDFVNSIIGEIQVIYEFNATADVSEYDVDMAIDFIDLNVGFTNSSASGGATWHANQTNTITGKRNESIFQVNVTDNATYLWNCRVCDAANNCNWSLSNFTLNVNTSLGAVIDNEYPSFVNAWDNNGTLNDTGIAFFNVSILKSNGSAFLQINGTNFTAQNWSTTEYNISLIIAGGVYEYQWISWGNGSSRNINKSIIRYYTVNTSAAADTVYPNVTLNSPANYANSTSINISFNCTSYDNTNLKNVTLYFNSTAGATTSSVVLVQSQRYMAPYLTTSTAVNCTLPSPATAGNLLVAIMATDKNGGAITAPSGYTMITSNSATSVSAAMAYKIATGGETSGNWTYATAEEGGCWIGEYSGLASSNVLDVYASNYSEEAVSVAKISTNTTATTSQANEFLIAMFAIDTDGNALTSRSWSNGFVEWTYVEDSTANGSPGISIANNTVSSTGAYETTSTYSPTADQTFAILAAFKTASTSSGVSWHANETKAITGKSNETIFQLNLTNGTYIWNCLATDAANNFNWSLSNFTLNVNTSLGATTNNPPSVTLVSPSNGAILNYTNVTFNCNVTDTEGLANVTLYLNGSQETSGSEGGMVIQVTASADDSEECISTGANAITSTDLELGQDAGVCATEFQWVAVRFQNVQIPAGATIWNASIDFEIDVQWANNTNVTIYGEDIDSAPLFTTTASNISSRVRTTNFAEWNNIPNNAVDAKIRSGNISAVIQEIVSRPGWASGNSIVLLINGSGIKETEAYDGETTAAARLYINYTTSASSTEVMVANITNSVSGTVNSTTFYMNLTNFSYKWNCLVTDNNNNRRFASSNYTLIVNTSYSPAPTVPLYPMWCGLHAIHTNLNGGTMTQSQRVTNFKTYYDCGMAHEHDDASTSAAEWTSVINEANGNNTDSNFTYFFGMEWTGTQHIAYVTLNPQAAPEHQSTVANLAAWMQRNDSVGQHDHPARSSGSQTDFSNSANYNDTWITLVEFVNQNGGTWHLHWNLYWNCSTGSGCTTYTNPRDPSSGTAGGTGWIKYALDTGRHLGFSCGNDYHNAYPLSPQCFTGLANLTTTWNRTGIISELRARHTWAAENKTIMQVYANNGTNTYIMGDIFSYSSATENIIINYTLNASTGLNIVNVSLFYNGVIVNHTQITPASTITGSFKQSLRAGQEDYIFIQATQSNAQMAWSSPMWVNYTSTAVAGNNAPNNPTVIINSTDGTNKTAQDLNCFTNVSDPDGNRINVTVAWYNNSILHSRVDYNNSYANNTFFNASLDNSYTTKAHNWSCGMRLYDGTDYTSWINSSLNVTIANTAPTLPVLSTPASGSTTTNRAPNFTWSASTDVDSDSLTYELNISLIAASTCSDSPKHIKVINGSSYQIISDLKCFFDNLDYYNWSARAFDGTDYSSWSKAFFLNISSELTISLPNNSVQFNDIHFQGTNDTSGNTPKPFLIQNDGNAFVNVTIKATNLWSTVANPTSNYRFKIDNYTLENYSFIWGKSVTAYNNIPAVASPLLCIAELNYTNATDTAEIDINITVPSDEGSGVRSSTITFTSSLAE